MTTVYQGAFKLAEFCGSFQQPDPGALFLPVGRTLQLQADSYHLPAGPLSILSHVLTVKWARIFVYLVRSLWEHSHYYTEVPVLSTVDSFIFYDFISY